MSDCGKNISDYVNSALLPVSGLCTLPQVLLQIEDQFPE